MPLNTQLRRTWLYLNFKEVAEILDIHLFIRSRCRKEYREGKLVAEKRKQPSLFFRIAVFHSR